VVRLSRDLRQLIRFCMYSNFFVEKRARNCARFSFLVNGYRPANQTSNGFVTAMSPYGTNFAYLFYNDNER
jgi:hypothetical protein